MKKAIASACAIFGLLVAFSPTADAESDNLCVIATLTRRSACIHLPSLPPLP